MAQGIEGFDAATLLRGSSEAWQRLFAMAFSRVAEQAAEEGEMRSEEADKPAGRSKNYTGSRGGRGSGKRKKGTD